MFPELPEKWEKQLEGELSFVRQKGFYLTHPIKAQKTNTLGLIFSFDAKIKKKIYDFVKQSIPNTLLSKLYIQPYEGYHITIQSSKDRPKDTKKLVELTKQYFQDSKSLKGSIFAIYPSDNSLLGITTIDAYLIKKTRADLAKIFKSCEANPKYNPKTNIYHFNYWSTQTWVSLARPTSKFTDAEIELTTKLPKSVFTNVVFDKAILTYNDPFFTPKFSEILAEINLIS